MKSEQFFRNYPNKRIKPTDGMEITADVWEEAHEFHSQRARFHDLLSKGDGVLAGLTVRASDPADTSVFIMPGVAVDSDGNQIVVPQPVTYDIGTNNDGLLFVVLLHGESRPRLDRTGSNVYYVHSEFSIQALPVLPDGPYVELARVLRSTRDAVIRAPALPDHPGADELDIRFRKEIGLQSTPLLRAGVAFASAVTDDRYAQGFSALARSLRHAGLPIWVDFNVAIEAETLSNFQLIYLLGQETFTLKADKIEALTGFVQQGGLLFMESVQADKGETAADASFTALAKALGRAVKKADHSHAMYTTPNLFAALPDGSQGPGEGKLQIADGVLFSTAAYGPLWGGEFKGKPAARELIRNATEFGMNLATHAHERRQSA